MSVEKRYAKLKWSQDRKEKIYGKSYVWEHS